MKTAEDLVRDRLDNATVPKLVVGSQKSSPDPFVPHSCQERFIRYVVEDDEVTALRFNPERIFTKEGFG